MIHVWPEPSLLTDISIILESSMYEHFNSFFSSGHFSRLLKPLQTIWDQTRADNMSVLIWIQLLDSDSVPEKLLLKKSADDNKSMKNYEACRYLNVLSTNVSWACLTVQGPIPIHSLQQYIDIIYVINHVLLVLFTEWQESY